MKAKLQLLTARVVDYGGERSWVCAEHAASSPSEYCTVTPVPAFHGKCDGCNYELPEEYPVDTESYRDDEQWL